MNRKRLLDILMWIPVVNYFVFAGLLFWETFIRRKPVSAGYSFRILGTFLLGALLMAGIAGLLRQVGVTELGWWGHLLTGLLIMPWLIRVTRREHGL